MWYKCFYAELVYNIFLMTKSKEEYVFLARMAEQSERYDGTENV